jgi:chemotaxis protein methyltransferase CheR
LTGAMALDQAGWFDRAKIEIIATDASPVAIEKARAGLYRER